MMEHRIEYDSDAKIVVGTTSGAATVQGLREYVDDLAGHAWSDPRLVRQEIPLA